jgi:hypothetical protein
MASHRDRQAGFTYCLKIELDLSWSSDAFVMPAAGRMKRQTQLNAPATDKVWAPLVRQLVFE